MSQTKAVLLPRDPSVVQSFLDAGRKNVPDLEHVIPNVQSLQAFANGEMILSTEEAARLQAAWEKLTDLLENPRAQSISMPANHCPPVYKPSPHHPRTLQGLRPPVAVSQDTPTERPPASSATEFLTFDSIPPPRAMQDTFDAEPRDAQDTLDAESREAQVTLDAEQQDAVAIAACQRILRLDRPELKIEMVMQHVTNRMSQLMHLRPAGAETEDDVHEMTERIRIDDLGHLEKLFLASPRREVFGTWFEEMNIDIGFALSKFTSTDEKPSLLLIEHYCKRIERLLSLKDHEFDLNAIREIRKALVMLHVRVYRCLIPYERNTQATNPAPGVKPQSDPKIRMSGSGGGGVSDLRIENMTLAHDEWYVAPNSLTAPQSVPLLNGGMVTFSLARLIARI